MCYTLQIYFDFSGYSDMAIGLGRMFGFRFPENFRWPYIASSVQDFWRRWHLSLSTWFRDYLYIPLGGNRVPLARQYRNLVTVFFLCGLWHGASWNFVIWGLWHGAFLVIERVARRSSDRQIHRSSDPQIPRSSDPQILRSSDSGIASWPLWPHAYTLLVVMIGWVFFRADTLPAALAFLRAMFGLNTAAPSPLTIGFFLTPELWIALVAGVVGSTPWIPALAKRDRGIVVEALGTAALAAALFASILQMAARTYNPFIYFRF